MHSNESPAVSRRVALAGIGAGSLGLALTARGVTAQEGAGGATAHPLVGTWAVVTSGGIVPQIHGADGSVVAAFPPNYVDPMLGLVFQGPALGRWEADSERSGPFTFFQALSDADGAYVGIFQLSDVLTVSEDGRSWSGSPTARIIVRDAANNVVSDDVVPIDPPATGVRVGVNPDDLVLPVVPQTEATPTA